MTKTKKRLVFGGAAVLIAAVGATWYVRSRPKPTPVEIATVGREDLQAKVTANGRVQAKRKVDKD